MKKKIIIIVKKFNVYVILRYLLNWYHHNNLMLAYNNTRTYRQKIRKIHSRVFGWTFYTTVVLLLRGTENRIITINCCIKTTVVIRNIEKADGLGTFMIKVRTCATTLDVIVCTVCMSFVFTFTLNTNGIGTYRD